MKPRAVWSLDSGGMISCAVTALARVETHELSGGTRAYQRESAECPQATQAMELHGSRRLLHKPISLVPPSCGSSRLAPTHELPHTDTALKGFVEGRQMMPYSCRLGGFGFTIS